MVIQTVQPGSQWRKKGLRMSLEKVVIVGGGPAGTTAAVSLRNSGFTGGITVVRSESELPYNRTTVNKGILTGAATADSVSLPEAAHLDVEWLEPDPAVRLDAEKRTLQLASGRRLDYSAVIISTGAHPRPAAFAPPPSTPGYFELRNLPDALRLRQRVAEQPATVLIIGAGLIGVETAGILAAAGCTVTLSDPSPLPMKARFGRNIAQWIEGSHGDHRVRLRTGVRAVSVTAGRAGSLVTAFDDGGECVADVVISSIGVTPTTGWLADSSLTLEDGIVVDHGLRAIGVKGVYAAGDVARIRGMGTDARLEHWGAAISQGRIAARSALEDLLGPLEVAGGSVELVPSYSSYVHGTKLTVIGNGRSHARDILVHGSPDDERYTVALLDAEDRILAAIGVGGARVVNRLKPAVHGRLLLEEALDLVP
jgi:3-phenylpropionate/trans-cinnamate dioxygenase ferredoxin reductase subunit